MPAQPDDSQARPHRSRVSFVWKAASGPLLRASNRTAPTDAYEAIAGPALAGVFSTSLMD
jgi:hypothetical protein